MQHRLVSPETLPLSLTPPLRCEAENAENAAPLSRIAVTPDERRVMQARIRRLRRRSLLTPHSLEQLGEARLPTETLHALLTMLEGPFEERWEERAAAAWALGIAHLTPRQTETVSHTLCTLLRRKPIVGRGRADQTVDPTLVWLSSYGALLLALYVVLLMTHPALSAGWSGIAIYAFASVTIGARLWSRALKMAGLRRESRLRSTAATALGRIGSASSVATLARAALDTNGGVRRAAEDALLACLDRITPDHAAQMEADVVPNLCRLLDRARQQLSHNSPEAEALALQVLEALERIGDGRAAPAVRNMINTGWTAPVNHAAKQLLPLLLERRQQETNQRMLLRGAVMPLDPPSVLLRATGLHEDEDAPETLLRSSRAS